MLGFYSTIEEFGKHYGSLPEPDSGTEQNKGKGFNMESDNQTPAAVTDRTIMAPIEKGWDRCPYISINEIIRHSNKLQKLSMEIPTRWNQYTENNFGNCMSKLFHLQDELRLHTGMVYQLKSNLDELKYRIGKLEAILAICKE